jgi:putative FmdB family regulatory protein
MPMFEYRCEACGQCFEKLQKAGEEALPACPACGSPTTMKLISPFAGVTSSSAGCFSGG